MWGGHGAADVARLPGFVLSRGRIWGERAQGSGMHIDPSEGHPAMDYAEHQRTYKMFLKLSVYIVVATVALMAFLALFVV
jgi:hypothetical protein